MVGKDDQADIPVDKTLLRQHYLGIRKGMGHQVRADKNLAILAALKGLAEMAQAGHIFTYISYGFEPDTHKLIDWLLSRDIKVSVPRVMVHDKLAAVAFPGWSDIIKGPRGVPQPDSSQILAEDIDVCITPALSFTETGFRLGYGAGYYDRWFNEHDVPVKIGITFEESIAPQLPVQAHDMPVDIVITEERIIRLR